MRQDNDSKLELAIGSVFMGMINLWARPLMAMAKAREYCEKNNHPILDKAVAGTICVYMAPYLLAAKAVCTESYIE